MNAAPVEVLDRELEKRWFEKRSPLLNATFEAERSEALRNEIGHACQLVSLLYLAFGVMDALLISDVLVYTLVLRIIVGLVYASALGVQIRCGVGTRILELQCALGIVFGFAAWLTLAAQSVEVTSFLYYAGYGLIFMLVANLFFNLRFDFAVLSSGLITAIFLSWAAIFVNDKNYVICFGSLYILSFLLTAFLNFKYNRERYRVYLNSCRADVRQREVMLRGEELLRLSTTDALTGLSNRRAIDEALQDLWRERISSGTAFGIVLIDVDYFKLYNDRYGHQQGDWCLAAVAQAMKGVAQPREYVIGRFGGEEFAALFPAVSVEQVLSFAEELRCVVESLQIPHGARRDQTSVITVSIGAAFSIDVTSDKPERTVTAADLALYVAKDDGRNRVRMFNGRMLDVGTSDGLTAEILRSSITQGRVSVVFQPIVNIMSGEIWAAEALMRLKDDQGRMVSPEIFIPLAERTGTILALGEWIIREACDLLANEPLLSVVSVNVSMKQIDHPEFVAFIKTIVRETGIAPSRLALEITESGQISGNPEIARSISQLSDIGVRVWLDDFGTGFAGLSCLSELRFDTVKIDRFFVQSCDTPRGGKLLRDIVELVQNCAHRIIVEGVEEARQVELIASFGVELFQGYHLGRPMPRQDLIQRLPDTMTSVTFSKEPV